MKIMRRILFVAICLFVIAKIVPSTADELLLENGDRVTVHIAKMEDGKLIFDTAYAGKIAITCAEIVAIGTDEEIHVVPDDGTSLIKVGRSVEMGKLKLSLEGLTEPPSFALADIQRIDPEPEPAIKVILRTNVGASVSKGNTDTETYHLDSELVARTAKNRFTAAGE